MDMPLYWVLERQTNFREICRSGITNRSEGYLMRNSDVHIGTVLTIADSDSMGQAGIQADLRTINAFGLHGMSVITAMVVQDALGQEKLMPVAPEIVEMQLDGVFQRMMPDCVKIGTLASTETVQVVVQKIKQYRPKLVVLDPVMFSDSGKALLDKAGKAMMVKQLFPMVTVVTPNLLEAEELVKISKGETFVKEQDAKDGKRMAESISLLFGDQMDKKHAILIKGVYENGEEAQDYLYWFRQFSGKDIQSIVEPQEITTGRKVMEFSFSSRRVERLHTYGADGMLASAIACGLAKGRTVETSVRDAKKYVAGAVCAGFPLGSR